ncbi:MAG: VacJ family lipoprotein [Candidatus Rokubacteria bacterium]|nr:VacJ family lipoprotein [Candidatus Rokubacteria bacterium]
MPRSLIQGVLVAALAVAMTGCATTTASLHTVAEESEAPVLVAFVESPVLVAADYRLDGAEAPLDALLVAQAAPPSAFAADGPEEEYDPWEPFNEKMFEFNRRLDRYVLKPVAQAYNTVVPDRVQVMVSNGFDNISFVPRMMNSIFQGKLDGAVREFGRFLFNSTIGIGGLFDVAKLEGIEKSREDFGQTLGFYGFGPGPYLILPLMEPLTVRDAIGKGVDGFMDPLSHFLPFFWTRLGMKVGETVNDRSLNLELFQGFEESVIDMYSAVRHGYLKRREKLIKE